MAINSGKMRQRFELLSPVRGADGEPARNEHGEETGELEVIQRPWCEITTIVNSENNSTAINDQEQIGFNVRFSKMYNNAANNMSIRFEGELYDVTSAVDPFKGREKIKILAIKRR